MSTAWLPLKPPKTSGALLTNWSWGGLPLACPGDRYNYHEDVAEAVATLAADAAQAKRQAQCWCIWDTVTNTGPPGSMLKLKRNESSLS